MGEIPQTAFVFYCLSLIAAITPAIAEESISPSCAIVTEELAVYFGEKSRWFRWQGFIPSSGV
ncbi:hypothetical protein EDM57_17780 [Brevibacillus gelatini]|uniref:Uncharacterized protein n=1 Tax=Brevibacillus gelatini TaxID=1655277 RepID=A0A3M8ASW7_9BACL|nr:hypothetical protein EDM57_17780 [Brevibacillus gelatini]